MSNFFALTAGGEKRGGRHLTRGPLATRKQNELVIFEGTRRRGGEGEGDALCRGSDVFLASSFLFCSGHLSEAVFSKVVLGRG